MSETKMIRKKTKSPFVDRNNNNNNNNNNDDDDEATPLKSSESSSAACGSSDMSDMQSRNLSSELQKVEVEKKVSRMAVAAVVQQSTCPHSATSSSVKATTRTDKKPNHKRLKTSQTKLSHSSSPSPPLIESIVMYPLDVPLPSKTTVKAIFDAVIELADNDEKEQQANASNDVDPIEEADHDNDKKYTIPEEELTSETLLPDQVSLLPAGILSFAQVLLPCVAHEENIALKRIQSIVQRDCPQYKFVIENCRKGVYDGIAAAIVAANQSKQRRVTQYQQLLVQQQKQRVLMKQEQYQLHSIDIAEQRREQRKKFPFNQDVYREQAQLLQESAQLDKEERYWKSTLQDLKVKMDGPSLMQQKMEVDQEQVQSDTNLLENQTKKDSIEYLETVQQELHSLEMSANRMERALAMVEKLLRKAEVTRKALYQTYYDQLFAGYPGMNDPKGLLKVLSQSQTQTQSSRNDDEE